MPADVDVNNHQILPTFSFCSASICFHPNSPLTSQPLNGLLIFLSFLLSLRFIVKPLSGKNINPINKFYLKIKFEQEVYRQCMLYSIMILFL